MEHARQYELLQNNHKEYENVITPLTQDELYHIQKTERDTYRKEFNEVDCLINYFRDSNINIKNLEKYYKLIQEDFELGFSKGISMLQHAKIINKNLAPETIEQNKKIYKRICDFLEKETKFAKERQDHIKNKEDINKIYNNLTNVFTIEEKQLLYATIRKNTENKDFVR